MSKTLVELTSTELGDGLDVVSLEFNPHTLEKVRKESRTSFSSAVIFLHSEGSPAIMSYYEEYGDNYGIGQALSFAEDIRGLLKPGETFQVKKFSYDWPRDYGTFDLVQKIFPGDLTGSRFDQELVEKARGSSRGSLSFEVLLLVNKKGEELVAGHLCDYGGEGADEMLEIAKRLSESRALQEGEYLLAGRFDYQMSTYASFEILGKFTPDGVNTLNS